MSTINSVNNGLNGQTGTGQFVGDTNPTLISPVLGDAGADSIEFSTTAGIIGTATNDDADAGSVGEYINSTILSGSAISLTSNSAADITSISLSAGDWDVWGNVGFIESASSVSLCQAWISSTSATLPDPAFRAGLSIAGITGYDTPVAVMRFSLAAPATIYLSCRSIFVGGTQIACGYISARRVR